MTPDAIYKVTIGCIPKWQEGCQSAPVHRPACLISLLGLEDNFDTSQSSAAFSLRGKARGKLLYDIQYSAE